MVENIMQDRIKKIKDNIFDELEKVKDLEVLRALEIKYLGRKGEFTNLIKGIVDLGAEEKKKIGQLANEVKKDILFKIEDIKKSVATQGEHEFKPDITLPGNKQEGGHLNPITLIQNEIEDLFSSMGFLVLDGPELESDYFCFEALNIPGHHPARDMQDTFYVKLPDDDSDGKTDLVMRTHTSPVQVRAMLKYGAPLRCIVPGRVFRSEAIDATHEHTFYQVEGLMVGENISIANLLAVLKSAMSRIFKQEVNLRVRPSYFPFVEPGLEIDVSCTMCAGKGCSGCKNEGWLELIGAGLVHPNVLREAGIDPEKYSGFAFGIGFNRLVMMRYGINNIRLFNSGDLRFIKQF